VTVVFLPCGRKAKKKSRNDKEGEEKESP